MHVTTIKYVTPDMIWLNTVGHDCLCGEFMVDIMGEARKFKAEHKDAKQVDVFWHLDEYCERKYGTCHSQQVSIETLLYG